MAELNEDKRNLVRLMFDSGVFSAWSRGEKLTIDEYIEYVKNHKKYLYSYVNMDVVPDASSASGAPPTYKQTEQSAIGSYENQQIMKKAGLKPIPVFHQGEKFHWLERMLDEGEDYIGISTWKTNITQRQQREWLDDVFSLLTDENGKPIVKTHGFGISSPQFLLRYPWFTVDSTTWVLSAGFGKIFVPRYKDDKPDYLQKPINVIVSGRESVSKSANRMQFESFGEMTQDYIIRFLKEELNLTMFEVRNIPEARRHACLMYYNKLCEHLEGVRFKYKKHGLFLNGNTFKSRKALKETWNLQLMFATNLSRKFSHVLSNAGSNTRLLSYYELRDKPDKVLRQYVRKGIVGGPYHPKKPPLSWNLEAYLIYRATKFMKRYGENDAAERTS